MSVPLILFSAEISNVTSQEQAWIERLLKEKAGQSFNNIGFSWSFEKYPDGSTFLYIPVNHERGGDIERLAAFVRAFLAKWRPDDTFKMQYAALDVDGDAYGGGVVVLTATEQRRYSAEQALKLAEVEASIRRALDHAETVSTVFDGQTNPYLEVGNSFLQEELLIPLNEALISLGLSPSELWQTAQERLDVSLNPTD